MRIRLAPLGRSSQPAGRGGVTRSSVWERLFMCGSALVATAVLYLALVVGAGSASQVRSMASCTPSAYNNVGSGQGQAVGVSNCGSPAPCFLFDVRLTTRGGSLLTERLNTNHPLCGYNGSYPWPTGNTPCHGYYVHSFFYMNVNGAGSSFTSSDTLC